MSLKENILISLDSRHAKNIYAGTKRVELRRRTMHVEPGTTVWIYEKVPVGSVTGYATVTAVHTASPKQLWSSFGSISGLSKKEFFTYFADLDMACALLLDKAQDLKHPLPLASLKKAAEHFHPPQFFVRLAGTHPVLKALSSRNNKRHTVKLANQPSSLVAA